MRLVVTKIYEGNAMCEYSLPHILSDVGRLIWELEEITEDGAHSAICRKKPLNCIH